MSPTKTRNSNDNELREQLEYLKLSAILEHYKPEAAAAAQRQLSHVEYLARLIDEEAQLRRERSIARRIKLARFPVIKSLEVEGLGGVAGDCPRGVPMELAP